MDSDKIIQDLNRRFAAPLPEFYKRRIVFWYDEDQEFVDKLDEITVSGAKVIALTGNNNFYVKKLLAVDDPTSNYLVYSPLSYESLEDDWLLDMELYGEEFRADLVSMWMDEMGVPQTPALRRGFKQYRKFFNAQSRRNKVAAQSVTPSTPAQLQMAIMAALAGLKDAKPNGIIKAVLKAGLEMGSNAVYQEFVSYGIDEAFWRMVAQGTGYQDMDTDLAQLATHILLTASTRTMRQEFLAGLQMFISSAHQAYCYDFVSDWMHSEDASEIYDIAVRVESELKLPQRFMKLQVADLVDSEIFPCVNEVILVKLMTEISDHIIDVDTITQTVEKRRTCVWYDDVKNYYEGILQVAKMQAFFKEHSAGFHTVEPAKIWKEYTKEYYIMDTYYREFHKSYSESLKNYHEELSDLFTHVMEKVEGLYVTWFLGQLGKNWTDACSEDLQQYGRVLEVDQQVDFYRRKVAASDNKVYVIISDAMRYEVAATLAEQLRRETQAQVDLKSMQGIFPTITKFGMAALLPHKEMSVELKTGKTERLAVLADGQSTEANNRDKLLKGADKASVALKYKDIIGMKRAERQALIKGMNVVYIYHDTIDEAGHLESSIFSACDTAIDELKNMVRIIANEWGGANIIITSDHGFLYTYSPLREDDKVDSTGFIDRMIEYGRRFAIMQKEADPDYLQKVRFLGGNTEYEGFAPKENIRIKMKGGGLNFVHGGTSLQEMVVPVIEYHFLRNQSKEYKKNKSKYDTKPVEMLTGRYSGSAESAIDYDIKRFTEQDPVTFLKNTEAGELSDAFWNTVLVQRLDTSVASSPYFLVFLMAQVKRQARGFLSKQITVQSLINQRGDIHHIFPKKYLQKNGVDARKDYNQIANYAYTQSETNIKIKDDAPCDYMARMKQQVAGEGIVYGGITDPDDLKANLAENCVPEAFMEMDIFDYQVFLDMRRNLMAQYIREYYESLE